MWVKCQFLEMALRDPENNLPTLRSGSTDCNLMAL
jgi:hypothetical protein